MKPTLCAIAICHSQNSRHGTAKYRSWKEFVETQQTSRRSAQCENHSQMIYRLTGQSSGKESDPVVVDVNGVAYEVNVPLSTYDSVGKVKDEVALYTVLVIREDDLQLYGFATRDERKSFQTSDKRQRNWPPYSVKPAFVRECCGCLQFHCQLESSSSDGNSRNWEEDGGKSCA